jgi:tetratricopeptide (TPR) repeat protein
MRVAVVIAPWDSSSSDAGAWSDGVAMLGASLARLGFRVAVVGEGQDLAAELAQALQGVAAEDTVLVHVGGRLARRGVLRVGAGQWMPLRTIGEVLAAHAAADVSVLAELLHEDDAEDALVAADHVASIVSAIGARERGYGMVAAVRPAGAPASGLAFTRLFLDVAAAAPREQALLSTVYERMRAMPESLAVAQSFTLVRGRAELELTPPAPPAPDLDAEIDAATAISDWSTAVDLRRRRLASHDSPRARVKELLAIARIMQQEFSDTDGALAALEEARAIEPRRAAVLQNLKRGYEVLGRWASAIEVTSALAAITPMPADRAVLRYEQARMVLDHLQDEEGAAGLLEQVLEEDPTHAEARTTLTMLRSSLTPPEPMPVPESSGEVETAPPALVSAASAVVAVAVAAEAGGDELDPATHARAFAEHMASGRNDSALLSAMALEELGAGHVDATLMLEQFRSVTPVRARGTLDAPGWELLRPYGMDEVLTALFAAVARPGCMARIEQLTARGRLVALDPSTRLDEESTASVVRSFQWAARVLGVRCPELFVVPDVPGEIAAVRAPVPSTAVGPSVVSGRSAKDLAFLAGRHLTYYRPEHQVLVYFPTRDELTRLLLAAVSLTKPETPPTGEGARAVASLAARLDRNIDDNERNDLRRAVWELEVRGGKFSVSAWTRNVELMAARAGLLLSGDLATAMAIVSNESRAIAALPLEVKRRDLIAFCVSDEHASLRARFAVSAPGSVRPPAPAAAAAYR